MTEGGPKYRRIAADLRERIRSGAYPAGSVLPAQRKLGEEYAVTLMTVRQALQLLEDDGLIAQQAGRGTYVLPQRPSHDLQSLRSLAEDLASQGLTLRTDVLGRQERQLPARVAAQLGAGPSARGLRLERLRTVEGRPVVHQVSWVPQPWGALVRDCDFGTEPLYGALARVCSLAVARAVETLGARGLPEQLARRLEQPPGRPVLAMERVTFDGHDRAFVADTAIVLDDGVQVVTERLASSTVPTWRMGSA